MLGITSLEKMGLVGWDVSDRDRIPLVLKDLETGRVRIQKVGMSEEKRRAVVRSRLNSP